MKFNQVKESLKTVKRTASFTKEAALNHARETKGMVEEAISNKGSVWESFKTLGKTYLKMGMGVPKAIKTLTMERSVKGALNELMAIPKGGFASMFSTVGLTRSAATSFKNKAAKPFQAAKKLAKLPLVVGPAIGNTLNTISDLLPTAGASKPAKQVDESAAAKKKDLTGAILPGAKEQKADLSNPIVTEESAPAPEPAMPTNSPAPAEPSKPAAPTG